MSSKAAKDSTDGVFTFSVHYADIVDSNKNAYPPTTVIVDQERRTIEPGDNVINGCIATRLNGFHPGESCLNGDVINGDINVINGSVANGDVVSSTTQLDINQNQNGSIPTFIQLDIPENHESHDGSVQTGGYTNQILPKRGLSFYRNATSKLKAHQLAINPKARRGRGRPPDPRHRIKGRNPRSAGRGGHASSPVRNGHGRPSSSSPTSGPGTMQFSLWTPSDKLPSWAQRARLGRPYVILLIVALVIIILCAIFIPIIWLETRGQGEPSISDKLNETSTINSITTDPITTNLPPSTTSMILSTLWTTTSTLTTEDDDDTTSSSTITSSVTSPTSSSSTSTPSTTTLFVNASTVTSSSTTTTPSTNSSTSLSTSSTTRSPTTTSLPPTTTLSSTTTVVTTKQSTPSLPSTISSSTTLSSTTASSTTPSSTIPSSTTTSSSSSTTLLSTSILPTNGSTTTIHSPATNSTVVYQVSTPPAPQTPPPFVAEPTDSVTDSNTTPSGVNNENETVAGASPTAAQEGAFAALSTATVASSNDVRPAATDSDYVTSSSFDDVQNVSEAY